MIPSFTLSTRTFQGVAWENVIAAELARLGSRHALIVTDAGVQAAGLLDRVATAVANSCERVSTYSQVFQDPTARVMDELGHRCVSDEVDVLVALGGGACLDAAKAAALVARHRGSILDLIGEDKVAKAPLPVIAIPTTAGTGSEVSWHISVNDDRNDRPARCARRPAALCDARANRSCRQRSRPCQPRRRYA